MGSVVRGAGVIRQHKTHWDRDTFFILHKNGFVLDSIRDTNCQNAQDR